MLENILNKIADLEQSAGLDIWSVFWTVVIVAGIVWFLRWGFKAFFD